MNLASSSPALTRDEIARRVSELGPWFHNLSLGGIETAPAHFLGDYPAFKWREFQHALPLDLSGKSVLDVGCNAGFYSIAMKQRGAARVVGIDSDADYLAQARFAAEVNQVDIEFAELDVYNVAQLGERFDLVLFMGVLYHLRHPLLALDLLYEHAVKNVLVFQSLLRGSRDTPPVEENYQFDQTEVFGTPGFPLMYFVEHRYANDPTNWWIPNRACVEAMLRSAGFTILQHPADEVYICGRGTP